MTDPKEVFDFANNYRRLFIENVQYKSAYEIVVKKNEKLKENIKWLVEGFTPGDKTLEQINEFAKLEVEVYSQMMRDKAMALSADLHISYIQALQKITKNEN